LVTSELSGLSYDPLLEEGARNAVSTCLGVKPHERAVLVADRGSMEIAAALAAQLARAAKEFRAILLEDIVARPVLHLPPEMEQALEWADVSLFTASAQPGELAMRRAMTAIVTRKKMRHGHMVGINRQIMLEGMRADFRQVEELTRRVWEKAKLAKEITCETPAGTKLKATFDTKLKWIATPGIISPEKWGNLPGGETFTSPARVDGVYVADGSLGTWLAPKHGDMRKHPLRITIVDSRIVDLECRNAEALKDFRGYVKHAQNGDRVGEFALGTNLAVHDIIGNMLQDEKIPGVHIAFGHPYSEHTGATWTSETHIDVVGRDFDVWFDGTPVMKRGKYILNGTK
jgi:leucyl aminopeptidase (aminopeptidase T)